MVPTVILYCRHKSISFKLKDGPRVKQKLLNEESIDFFCKLEKLKDKKFKRKSDPIYLKFE